MRSGAESANPITRSVPGQGRPGSAAMVPAYGTSWVNTPSPSVAPGRNRNRRCEAAGEAGTSAGRLQSGLLEKWNGTTWSVQKKVLPAGDKWAGLPGISCTTGPVCEAVGYHGPAVDGTHLLALRYSS